MKRLFLLICLVTTAFPLLAKATGDSTQTSIVHPLCSDTLILDWAQRYQLLPGMINTPQFLQLFEDWKGTPYRYGGSSRKGIDCSGFVSMLYDSVHRIVLNGGSADIFKQVTPVSKEELQEGDLVFFRIHKKRISHVGLYLSNDKFIHATTRGGVMINDLKEPYYKRYYYKAGRLPELNPSPAASDSTASETGS